MERPFVLDALKSKEAHNIDIASVNATSPLNSPLRFDAQKQQPHPRPD